MSKAKVTVWLALGIIGIVYSSAFAEKIITFDNDKLGGVKPLKGAWSVDAGILMEKTDGSDKQGRPLFATIMKDNIDNVMLSAEFELYDAAGDFYLCPSWKDPNNYVAAVWHNKDTIRLVSVNDNRETLLAEKKFEHIKPPYRMGVAVSGQGIRGYVNGEMAVEAAAIFRKSSLAALGSLRRRIGIDKIEESKVRPWEYNKSMLCPIKISGPTGRRVFYRMEEEAETIYSLKNLTDNTLESIEISMSIPGITETKKEIEKVGPGKTAKFKCPVPAECLRPDEYKVNISAKAVGYKVFNEDFIFTIVKRPNPERMTVMCWGNIPVQGADRLAEMGFTHAMNGYAEYEHIFKNPNARTAMRSKEFIKEQLRKNEDAMKAGVYTGMNMNIGHRLTHLPELVRIRRDGSKVHHYRHRYPIMCASLPKAKELSKRVAKLVAKTFGQHPAFRFVNINSEVRGGAEPCFHKGCVEGYKKATGLDVPEGELSLLGTSYKGIEGFPEDRIVPDDHPLLTYFRWHWKEGDGWVKLNDIVYDIMKKNCHKDFFCWHDPAVRTAAVYGSGGHIEIIGHWTYTNPDPIRIGMNADELLNMAQGKHKTYENVQAIWYRSRVALKERLKEGKESSNPWEDTDPDGRFMTPSPTQFTEAFWTALSRPVDMIGTHGINSLLAGNGGSYAATNPATGEAFEKLSNKLIKPYGPILKKIGNRPADAAFLESFASHMFARRSYFGWAGSSCWIACQYAGLQPDIIFDETIVDKGLEKYKVLIMPYCDVLTRKVYDKVVEFQKRGGIIIADENLVPGIKPDILMPEIKVKEQPDGQLYKEATLGAAKELRKNLSGKYKFFALSSNPEVVLHDRENDGVQYIFAINDFKEFGDYAGYYGMVMENGVPAETTITIGRKGVKVIDLLENEEVPLKSGRKSISFDTILEPGGGKIFVVTEAKPAKLTLGAPKKAYLGQTVTFRIRVLDENNDAMAGVVPFKIEILDPALRSAEPSGFYSAEKGKGQVSFDIAKNDMKGFWTIKVTELITGLSKTAYMELQ